MSKLRCHIHDLAGRLRRRPEPDEQNPLGEGGEQLHDWIVPLAAFRETHSEQGSPKEVR